MEKMKMKHRLFKNQRQRAGLFFSTVLLCLTMLSLVGAAPLAAAANVDSAIAATFSYQKGGNSLVMTDTVVKNALTDASDLLALAAGRYTVQNAVTADEFSKYLGYASANLTTKGGALASAADYLSAAQAVGAAGGTPTAIGTDSAGNKINLLYKGIYARSLTTLTNEGTATVANALLTLDALHISNDAIRAAGSKVTRAQLKATLTGTANTLSSTSVPDLTASGLVLQALAPYYRADEASVVSTVDALLDKLKGMQAANGSFNDSVISTAEILTGVCALGLDPTATNSYFTYSVYDGLLTFCHSDGGFGLSSSASSTVAATNYGRLGLVAYWCYQQNSLFYDFSGVTAHTPTKIAATSPSSSGTSSASSSKSSSSSSSSSSSGTSGTASTTTASASDLATTSAASGTTIAKSVFEGIQGQDTKYVYEGTWNEGEPYTISFNGKDITTPMDFNAAISSSAQNQAVIDAAVSDAACISFLQQGAFPGNAMVTVTVALADGNYKCYYYNADTAKFELVGDVTVANSMVSFEVNKGGDYFLTAEEIKSAGLSMELSDTVNGIVPQAIFQSIQGKDVNLRLSGTTDKGTAYTIIFNGADVSNPMDFDMRIDETSKNSDDIAKLADNAWILHFSQDGDMPGTALVEIATTLDGSLPYLLFYYNEDQKQAEYVGKVDIEDNTAKFTISHCCDYFLAEGAIADSLLGAGDNGNFNLLLAAYLVVGLMLLAAGIGFFLRHRKEQAGRPEKKKRLTARKQIAARKKAKAENQAETPTAATPAEPSEDGTVAETAETETAEDRESL